jgi:hypothetical protein
MGDSTAVHVGTMEATEAEEEVSYGAEAYRSDLDPGV